MDLTDSIDFVKETTNQYLDWLSSPHIWNIPYGKYAISAIVLLLIVYITRRYSRIFRLYFIAKFTSRGRIATIMSNVDGDTVKVNDPNEKGKKTSIRMIGVDTPESLKSLYMDVAPFGKNAADYTRKRLKPGMRLMLIYDVEPLDKFGRELVYVYLMSGEFYNATLIRKGYAFAAEYKPNLRYAKYFRKLENKAKRAGKRLWDVYDGKGELSKSYKRTKEYRRFKYKQDKQNKK